MQHIIEHIEQTTGKRFIVGQQQHVGGGCINAAFTLHAKDGQQFFVKTNVTGRQGMFAAEAKGLAALASTKSIRVPGPVCFGDDGAQSYIVMEQLEMHGLANQKQLGNQLAALHRHKAEQFGWDIDNTIGATPQSNDWCDDWLEFWREQRLGYQLRLAADNGYSGELQQLGHRLLQEMPKLFSGRTVLPSMLHGDLWGGNVAGLSDGTPTIFDPALYYGDREADIAMTYVFGGFETDFYTAYQAAYALDDGFNVRKTFYNIYHIINHLNMFGGGYHVQAIGMIKKVLAEI